MNPRLNLLMAAGVALFTAAAVRGEPPSHERIDDWSEGGSNRQKAARMEDRLRAGLGRPGGPGNVEPETIKKLLELLQRSDFQEAIRNRAQQDPNFARQLRDLAGNNPELRRQFENRSQANPVGRPGDVDNRHFEELLKRFDRARQDLPTPPAPEGTGGAPAPVGGGPGPTPGVVPPPGAPAPPTPPMAPAGTRDPAEHSTNPADEARAERFREFVGRLDRWFPNLRNSESMKRFMRKLGDFDWSRNGSNRVLPERFKTNLDLNRRLQGTGGYFERALRSLDGRRLPRMPNVSGPDLPSAPSVPNLGAPSAPSGFEASGGFTILAVIGAIIVGLFLVWKMLLQPMRARKEKPRGWQPGAWPVEPARVRTREDLIRAFDHLALVEGGRPARHWHHREVAHHLGTSAAERQCAAERLAGIYAQARYTPPQEPLPEAQIDAARQDLCTLAGAGPP